MALSQTDKDCIVAYHAKLTRPGKPLDATESGHLDDILTGTETEKIDAAKHYAEFIQLVSIQATLAVIDQQKTDLQAEETTLLAYIV